MRENIIFPTPELSYFQILPLDSLFGRIFSAKTTYTFLQNSLEPPIMVEKKENVSQKTKKQLRDERLAQALRDNLRRRKQTPDKKD